MRLDLPGITGSGELYLEIMRAICGDTSSKSMIDLMCHHAPYTPMLGFSARKYVDIQGRKLDDEKEQGCFSQADALKYLDQISLIGYDVAICSDGIEHLSFLDGKLLLEKMDRVSQKQIIFTPFGAYNITEIDSPDSHRSGWMPEDLPGFATIVLPHFHPELKVGAFFAWRCKDIEQDFERVLNLLNHKYMNKIDQIKFAIERSLKRQSRIDENGWSVPALSSLNIRHLMNNLGTISTRYFECGTHKGGIFCSVLNNNPNLISATANDSFESDTTNEDKAQPQFLANVKKCIPSNTEFKMLKGETFNFKPEDVLGPIDLYLFDADHSYESQKKAITHFLPAMADEFIMCIDDMDFPEVITGTLAGLNEAPVEIIFQEIWKGNDHDNDGAWNGYGIWLLKKK